MGWHETKLPCPDCGSSDALSINDDGWSTCFSCNARHPPEGTVPSGTPGVADAELYVSLSIQPLTKRGLTQETCEKFQYGINNKGFQVAQYYNEDGRIVAQKIRTPDKDFYVRGNLKAAAMFGSRLLRGVGKQVVIAEGEIDAMSIHQALGGTWPVLSLKSGASGAVGDVTSMVDILSGFERVVLAFDDDVAGHAAVEAVAPKLKPGTVFVAQYDGRNDANALLTNGGASMLRNAVWAAKPWRPDGVVNMSELREKIKAQPKMGTPYPWPKLNEMLYGYRPGEITTWTAGTGVGKTAVISEVAYHACVQDGRNVGILYLEEGVSRAGKRIVGIHMNLPIHLPGCEYTDEDFDKAFDETLGTERMFAYDHFGSQEDEIILGRIRYMVAHCKCEVVFLDHISIVVSGGDVEDDERRRLDKLMTDLRSLTEETNAALHIVSHLRRPPGSGSHEEGRQVSLAHLRGTQAIAQLSDTVIAGERNQQADDPIERNTTQLRVLKNRYAGITGPADRLFYDMDTGRLAAMSPEIIHTEENNGADF